MNEAKVLFKTLFVWFICMCCGLVLCLTGRLKSKIRGTGFVFLWRCVLWIMQISFRQTDLSHCVSSLSNHSVSFRCPCLVFTHILCVFVPSGVLLLNAFKVLVRIRDLHVCEYSSFFPSFCWLWGSESPRLNHFTAGWFCSVPWLTDRLIALHCTATKWVILSATPLPISDRIYMCPWCNVEVLLITEWQSQHFGQEWLDVLCWRPEGHTVFEWSCCTLRWDSQPI